MGSIRLLMASSVLHGNFILDAQAADAPPKDLTGHYASEIEQDKPTAIWGNDNLHMGFYPHFHGEGQPLSFPQAADQLTDMMIKEGGINAASRVLDLGSGKGRVCKLIAEKTGASCTGLDMTEDHVLRARELAAENPKLKLKFVQGSFTSYPKELLESKFTHAFSLAAFVHVQTGDLLQTTVKELVSSKVLEDNALVVVNDFTAGTGTPADEATKLHWYGRTNVPCCLHSDAEWRRIFDESGLILQKYFNLDTHQQFGYEQLAEASQNKGWKTKQGVSMETAMQACADAVASGQIGMNLAVYSYLAPKAKGEKSEL